MTDPQTTLTPIAVLKAASEMCEALPELNMSNYDHDDVAQLNSGAVELCLFLRAPLKSLGVENA